MQRRDMLKAGAALGAVSLLPARVGADTPVHFDPRPGAWRHFELTTEIDIRRPQGPARVWVPLSGFTADDWTRPAGDSWKAPGATVTVTPAGARGAKLLALDWAKGTRSAKARIVSRVATRDRAVDLSRPGRLSALDAAERARYTAPTALIPTDGIVKTTSDRIVASAQSDLDKARRIYEWIVANTFRDPKVPGCGIGNIKFMLESGDLGGKCADLNALFVGLARAAGVPARNLYGIRVAPSRFGYRSLGANSQDVTHAQHCRAEVHLANHGWVPVDPADVRKVALEEPPGHLAMTNAKVEAARATLFGAWETNWIAYNDVHDVTLPGADGWQVPFLMYPQGETVAARLDCLDAQGFHYTIAAREVSA